MVVIGETVRRELFAGLDPIGEIVRIQDLGFEGHRRARAQGPVAVALKVTSSDGGKALVGTTTYAGEGPIGFKARLD